jgi:hypothetical protein
LQKASTEATAFFDTPIRLFEIHPGALHECQKSCQLTRTRKAGLRQLTDLVEGDDVATLNVLRGLGPSTEVILNKLINGHLLVLDGHKDIELVDAVPDW